MKRGGEMYLGVAIRWGMLKGICRCWVMVSFGLLLVVWRGGGAAGSRGARAEDAFGCCSRNAEDEVEHLRSPYCPACSTTSGVYGLHRSSLSSLLAFTKEQTRFRARD